MKILIFKVPVTLKRDDKDGSVSMTLHEEKRELMKEEPLGDGTQDIVVLSKRIGDENETQKKLKQNSLFASEKEAEGHIVLKYLTD